MANIQLKDLIPGKTYNVQVRSTNANGEISEWSNTYTFIAPPDTSQTLENIYQGQIGSGDGTDTTGVLKSASFNGTLNTDFSIKTTSGKINQSDAGTVGWAIDYSGNAIFNNAYIRGTLDAGGVLIGKNAYSTYPGIKIDDNNYWYLNGSSQGVFSLGGTNGITYSGTGSVAIGSNVTIAGTVTATSFKINAYNYWNGATGTYTDGDVKDFRVGDASNYLLWDDSANSLNVVGQISATSGYIGGSSSGWQITSNTLQSVSGTSNNITLVNGTNPKIYIGTGTHANANTPFYADGAGSFSLGNQLIFNPANGVDDFSELTVVGKIRGVIENVTQVPSNKISATVGKVEINSSTVATITTGDDHAFLVNEYVVIEGVTGTNYTIVNGVYQVASVPGTNSFTIAITGGVISAQATKTGTISLRELTLGLHPAESGLHNAGIGIRLDKYNWWFTNNQFRVGSSQSYMKWDGANLSISGGTASTSTFFNATPNAYVSAIGNVANESQVISAGSGVNFVTSGFYVGMFVGGTGIPSASYITNLTSSSMTISRYATADASTTITGYLPSFGSGGSTIDNSVFKIDTYGNVKASSGKLGLFTLAEDGIYGENIQITNSGMLFFDPISLFGVAPGTAGSIEAELSSNGINITTGGVFSARGSLDPGGISITSPNGVLFSAKSAYSLDGFDSTEYIDGTANIMSGVLTVTNSFTAGQTGASISGRLLVSGSSNVDGSVTANTFYAPNWFRSTGNSGWYNGTYGGGMYMVDTTWVRTYNSKGLVGNGVYSSGNLTVVNGNVIANGTGTGTSYFQNIDVDSDIYGSADMYGYVAGGRALRIDSSPYRFGTSSSSRRVKSYIENIEMSQLDIENYFKIQPVTYFYTERIKDVPEEDLVGQVKDIGLIAEDLQDLGFRGLINVDEDGIADYVHYDKLSIYNAIIIKMQQEKIDSLEARLAALEAK